MAKDCSEVKTIQDVNDLWNYKDEVGQGKTDASRVSCGQDKESGYNELKDKYKKYYSKYSEKDVAQAMCECCKELKKTKSNPNWDDFYASMKNKGFSKKS
jgi:hypothetical protein